MAKRKKDNVINNDPLSTNQKIKDQTTNANTTKNSDVSET